MNIKVEDQKIITDRYDKFNTNVPMEHLMGFFEDIRKLMIHVRQELVLIRNSSNNDAFFTSIVDTEKPRVTINGISCLVPDVSLSLTAINN